MRNLYSIEIISYIACHCTRRPVKRPELSIAFAQEDHFDVGQKRTFSFNFVLCAWKCGNPVGLYWYCYGFIWSSILLIFGYESIIFICLKHAFCILDGWNCREPSFFSFFSMRDSVFSFFPFFSHFFYHAKLICLIFSCTRRFFISSLFIIARNNSWQNSREIDFKNANNVCIDKWQFTPQNQNDKIISATMAKMKIILIEIKHITRARRPLSFFSTSREKANKSKLIAFTQEIRNYLFLKASALPLLEEEKTTSKQIQFI